MPAAEWSHKAAQKHQNDLLFPFELCERNLLTTDGRQCKGWCVFSNLDKSRFYGHIPSIQMASKCQNVFSFTLQTKYARFLLLTHKNSSKFHL
jgi:hypothetical protein